jgi:hypothetical protein
MLSAENGRIYTLNPVEQESQSPIPGHWKLSAYLLTAALLQIQPEKQRNT